MAKIPEHEISDHLENTDTPAETLHQIATQQPGRDEFSAIAKHPNASEHTLYHMHTEAPKYYKEKADEGDSLKDIHQSIAAHPNAPKGIVKEHFDKIKPIGPDIELSDNEKDILTHPKLDMHDKEKKVADIINTNSPGVSYDVRKLVQQHFAQKGLSAPHIKEHVAHVNTDVAKHAFNSPSALPEHESAYINREDVGADELGDAAKKEGIHPSTLHEIHNKLSKLEEKEDVDHYDIRRAKKNILKHPNAPKEIVEKYANQQSEDGRSDLRQTALKHPLIDRNRIHGLVTSNDKDAFKAANGREDTGPETLRHIAENSELGKWGGYKNDAIKHPNFPEDLQMQYAKKDTDHQRAVLKRGELSPNVLKELVNSKNKNIAIDALKHKSVTSDVVDEAYKRKMKDVSVAASQHPLASAKMKTDKASADPEAAMALAQKSDDPDVLHSIYEAHPDNNEVHEKLLNNKNTHAKTIGDIAEKGLSKGYFTDEHRLGSEANNKASLITGHPNLPEEQRKKIALSSPGSAINILDNQKDTSSQEIEDMLNKHKGHDNRYLATNALQHGNLDPKTAKDIVSGEHGPINISGSDLDKIDQHGPNFDKEAIQAGIDDERPELKNKELTQHLASSSHLSADDINKHLDETKDFDTTEKDRESGYANKYNENRSKFNHELAKRQGFAKNPNIHPDKLNSLLNDPNSHREIIKSALQNPNLKEEHLKDFYTKDGPDLNRDNAEDTANKIKEMNLTDHALTNTSHEGLLGHLLKDRKYSNDLNKEKVDKLLENPNKEASHSAIINGLKGGRDSHISQHNQKIIDSFAGHKDKELATKLYPHMSKDAQSKMEDHLDYNNPQIIRGSKPENVSKLKITKDTPEAAAYAIVNHKGVTTQHKLDAIEHHPDLADSIAGESKGDELDQIHHKMLDLHNDDNNYANKVAKSTENPKILKRIIDDPDKYSSGLQTAAKNTNISTKDLDSLKKIVPKNPGANMDSMEPKEFEQFQTMKHAASNKKASADLLSHIAKNYPEHLERIAANPKVGSAKSMKAVLNGIKDMSPEDSHDIRLALADNEKVPQDAKNELFKDPRILFDTQSDAVTPEHIAEHSKSDDPGILYKVLNHKKLDNNGYENVVNKALESASKETDPDKKQALDSILSDASYRSINSGATLKPETAKKLADLSLKYAALAIGKHDMSEDDQKDLIDKHADKEGFAKSASASKYLKPKAALHLLDKLPDNEDKSKRVSDAIISSESNSTDSEDLNKLYDKSLDHALKGTDPAWDSVILDRVASRGNDSSIRRIAHNPEVRGRIFSNENSSPETLKKAISSLDSEKPSEGYGGKLPEIGHRELHDFFNNKNSTPDVVDHLVDAVYKNHDKYKEGDKGKSASKDIERIVSNHINDPKLSQKSIEKIYDRDGSRYPELIKSPNATDKMIDKSIENLYLPGDQSDTAEALAESPRLDIDKVNIDRLSPETKDSFISGIAQNRHATPKQLDYAYDNRYYLSDRNKRDSYKKMIASPNLSESTAMNMLDNDEIDKNDLYRNPAVGGNLFRADKHELPKLPNLDPKTKNNEAEYKPGDVKLNSIAKQIPKDGYIEWADFKKQNPKISGDPLVQKMFTTAPKARITKEHAEKFINELPGKKFHISYGKPWDGMQRHNEKNKQLVVQINNSEDMEKQIKADPELHRFYHMALDLNRVSGHPISDQGIGWSRVDTSNKDHFVVDEIQSDLGSSISGALRALELSKNGNDQSKKEEAEETLKYIEEKYGLNQEQIRSLVPKINKITSGWDEAIMNNIIDLAKKNGAKKVSIHSAISKHISNNENKGEPTLKYKGIYDDLPVKYGFKPSIYNKKNIPSAASGSKITGEDFHTLDLNEETPEFKKSDLDFGDLSDLIDRILR